MVKIYVPPALRPENKPHFWVSNICKRNVSLADLALTIPAYSTVDLLSKHYHFKLEQLETSAKDGSIYKKSDRIKVRNVPPAPAVKPGLHKIETKEKIKPPNLRSLIKIDQQEYEELEFSDEQYAEEAAEVAVDNEPLLKPNK